MSKQTNRDTKLHNKDDLIHYLEIKHQRDLIEHRIGEIEETLSALNDQLDEIDGNLANNLAEQANALDLVRINLSLMSNQLLDQQLQFEKEILILD